MGVKESIEYTVAKHVPIKKAKRTDEPRWLDAEVHKKIEEKQKAWKRWKATGRATDKAVYTGAERECKRMIRNKKNAYKHNIMKNRNMNPKQYYSYVNSAKRNKSL